MSRWRIAFVAIGLAGNGLVAGQSRAAELLSPVVVTGTRTERRIDDSPVRVEVVTRSELERSAARTLTDALRDVPGLHLTEVHGKSGYQVSMQGMNADQVLVLIDGLPVTASTGSSVDLSQTMLSDIERIEIVKGAASAQYGSAAMGGVINVITREPEPGLRGHLALDGASRVDQNASGEQYDLARRRLGAGISGGSERWRWRFGAALVDDDGFAPHPQSWPLPGDRVERRDVLGRLSWNDGATNRAFVEASRYDEDTMQRYERVLAPNRVRYQRDEAVARERLTAGLRLATEAGWHGEIKALSEHFQSDSLTTASGVSIIKRDATMDLEHLSSQLDLPRVGAVHWQVGMDLRRERLTQSNNGVSELSGAEVSRHAEEFHVQGDWFISDHTEVIAGARWQRDADFGSHLAPKLALRQELADRGRWRGALLASIGNGYRVPNLKERYYVFDHSALGYEVRGNQALQPESSTSLQIGTEFSRSDSARLAINLFSNRVRDLIQTDLVDAGSGTGVQTFAYANVARAWVHGIETSIEWPLTRSLQSRAAYTFTSARDVDEDRDLTRRPRSILRLGIDWQAAQATSLSARLRYQSSELVDSTSGQRSRGFAELDLNLVRRIGRDWEAFIAVENLLDAQRDFDDEGDFRPKSGRLVMAGVRIRFGGERDGD